MRLLDLLQRIDEAPLGDLKTYGMDKPLDVPAYQDDEFSGQNEPSMPAADVKMLKNPRYWKVVEKKFQAAPYTYNLHFANFNMPPLVKNAGSRRASGKEFSELFQNLLNYHIGAVPAELVYEHWGIPIEEQPGAIDVLFLSNADASTVAMRMTPWIMAHRLGHAVENELINNYESGDFQELQSYFTSRRMQLVLAYDDDNDEEDTLNLRDELGIGGPDPEMHDHYSVPYENLLTMKTARTGKMLPGEELPELIAQFILQGQITLARAVEPSDEDELVKFTNGYQMEDKYIHWNAYKEAEYMNEQIDWVENRTNEILNEYFSFWASEGVIFITP